MTNEQTAEEFIANRNAAQQELDKLRQSNYDKLNALSQNGFQPDTSVLAILKVETFIETFLDEDARLVYDRNLEIKKQEFFDEMLKQVRQSVLLNGVPQTAAKLQRK